MRQMTSPRCRTVRRWLEADHDGRLAPGRQATLAAHLERCRGCRRVRDELLRLGAALRQAGVAHRPDDAVLAPIAPLVLAGLASEPDVGWWHRLRDTLVERPRLWFVSGAMAATMGGILLAATVLGLGVTTHPGSLASLLEAYDYLGSNTNPVWSSVGVSLPHVRPDTRTAAILIEPFPPLQLKHLALSGVVTREGALTGLEVLHDDTPDAELARALSRLASDVRFVPARARGRAVAMNVVWVLERTTVAPDADRPDLDGV